jgi:diguanylate cyclase (GGDEF)-like protein/PAS domain S-box-containing protein
LTPSIPPEPASASEVTPLSASEPPATGVLARLGIQARVSLLLLVIGIPFLIFVVWSTSVQESIETQYAQQQSLALSRLVGARLDDHVGQIDTLLGTLAHLVSTRLEDQERTSRLVSGLRGTLPPSIEDITVRDLAGRTVARLTDNPRTTRTSAQNDALFRRVVALRTFAVETTTGGGKAGETIEFARPIVGPDASVVGVISLSERSQRIEDLVDLKGSLPNDGVVAVLDTQGRVIARSSDPDDWFGRSAPSHEHIQHVLARGEELGDTVSVDGATRVSGSRAMVGVPWVVSVSLSPEVTLGAARRHLYYTFSYGVALLAAMVLLAALAGRRMAAPIRQLARDARRFGSGDLAHRSAVHGGADVARLAETMNQMAESLHNQKLEVARSREWLKTITDSVPALIAYVDQNGRYAFANSHFRDIFGVSPAALIGRDSGELLDPETREYVAPFARQVLAGLPTRFEFPVRVGGERREFDAIYLPDYADEGAVRGYFVLARDVTNERRTARALEESERRVHTIADNMPLQIAYADEKSILTFANRAFAAAAQRALADVLGHHLSEVLAASVYTDSRAHFEAALRGEPVHFERTRVGAVSSVTEDVNIAPDFDDRGRVRGFYLLSYDISELKRTQQGLAKAERHLRSVTDNIPALIAHVDSEERYRFVNAATARLLDRRASTILGRSLREIWGELAYAEIESYIKRALRGERVTFEGENTVSGEIRYHLSDFIPDVDADGVVQGAYGMTFDITARKKAELRQAESEERLRTVTNNLPALICYIDSERRYIFNNQTYESWFGKPLSEITGHLMSQVHVAEVLEQIRPFVDAAFTGERSSFEVEIFRPDGGSRWVRGIYVPHRGHDGEVIGIYGMISDITSVKTVEQQLMMMAQFDGLTSLPNRRQFDEKLGIAIAAARTAGTPLALMFLDVDRFKSINDNFGHAAGDEVLREVAERLKSSVRDSDLVARLAGDEFVVLLESIHSAEEPQFVAKKVLSAVRKPMRIEGHDLEVSISIGIAYALGADLTGPGLLRTADRALYEAKNAGRDRFALLR